jgi:histidinol-phosphate aminotransferase
MNKYVHKLHLNEVKRIHPPKCDQKVDERLRLHRAERLYPFPDEFFNNFIKSINQEDIRYYPDVHQLKDKLAILFDLNSNNIIMNNGSSENIRIFYEAFAVKNKEVIITNPSYPMHKIYAQLQDSIIKEINYSKENKIDYKHIINAINDNTSCIVLANPNSPVGDIIELNKIEKIINKANEKDIPILIDEAYIEYANQKSCVYLLKKYRNLAVSRTFSKALGCAGLRIGYLLGNDELMNIINKFIPTYEISSIASKFGSYLLDNYKEVEYYISLIKKEKKEIGDLCKKYNIPCILNHINTIHLKPPRLDKIKQYLIEQKVLFRIRKLPCDDDEWLAIVLYPGFRKSNIFSKVIKFS